MTLGANFPPAYLRAQITRQLKPGTVIKLIRRMDDGKIHEKRFVVVHVDVHTITCIINSKVSTFLQQRPDMLRCQVAMGRAAHSFMNHDSHIDCSRVRTYSTAEVIDDLLVNRSGCWALLRQRFEMIWLPQSSLRLRLHLRKLPCCVSRLAKSNSPNLQMPSSLSGAAFDAFFQLSCPY